MIVRLVRWKDRVEGGRKREEVRKGNSIEATGMKQTSRREVRFARDGEEEEEEENAEESGRPDGNFSKWKNEAIGNKLGHVRLAIHFSG